MKLIEALGIVNRNCSQSPAAPFRVCLACGFTPLHLGTFVHAHMKLLLPDREIILETGMYGDLPGNIRRGSQNGADGIAIPLEWMDLDPRLGVRQLGGWTPDSAADVVANVEKTLGRLEAAISEAAQSSVIAVCPPALPLPPFSHEPGWQSGISELALRSSAAAFLCRIARIEGVRVVSQQAIDQRSPAQERFDIGSEIAAGFPYKAHHADVAGELLARLLRNAPPQKGLITDLDDTLWRGILGDAGVQGVCWDLSRKAQIHGLYQQFLAALAARGVLVAVVSKNDPALVAEAFETRDDLLVKRASLYPIEAGWGRKSEAVSRVLKAWNIGADNVIFIDDSPLELEEVKSVHPELAAFRFPADDPRAAWKLILELQDLFGKSQLREEDRLRTSSLRNAGEFSSAGAAETGPSEDEFLSQVRAVVTVDSACSAGDGRALELINKTNQFNLNGRRVTEAQWREHLQDAAAFLLVVSYEDKFGPLGKIAVMTGRRLNRKVTVTSWVMSCRAFSRRVEHQCLRFLFEMTGADEILLNYEQTPRNGPLRDFLGSLAVNEMENPIRIALPAFTRACSPLFHTVRLVPAESSSR